jgi:hypothetical protein
MHFCWGQSDDIFLKEEPKKENVIVKEEKPVQKDKPAKEKKKVKEDISENEDMAVREGITIDVDQDVSSGGGAPMSEKAKNDRWKLFFLGKNRDIDQLLNSILTIDSNTVTKESIDEYMLLVNTLKKDVESKLDREKAALWIDDDELDELNGNFFLNCEKATLKLNQWKEKLSNVKQKEPVNKLLILGICLAVVMVLVPILNQVKAGITMKKAKKQQAQLAKKQQEDMEKQMLLADSNMVTLKN